MKKSLIALSVLAAAGAASAQSSVQLYGIADVWFGSTKDKVTSEAGVKQSDFSQTKLESGGVSTSRIGFKGSEDLGNGLKANFVLEKAFAVDKGTADGGFDRQATVGLSGGFGSIDLGKNWTAYDDVRGGVNNTFDASFSATALTWVGYNANPANTIKFTSADYSGFSGALSYSLGEDKKDNASAGSVVALNLQYANGPVYATYAHQVEKVGDVTMGSSLAAVDGFNEYFTDIGSTYTQPVVANGDKMTYDLFAGSYDFGVVKVVAGFNRAKFKPVTGPNYKANEFQVGAYVPLSPSLTLAGGYASSKLKDDTDTLVKSTGFSLALNYSLSKRTSAYVALAQSKAEEQAASRLGEVKTNIYAVGLKHTF